MAKYRYEGFASLFKKDEDDKGTAPGETLEISKAMVDKYTEQGHRFTEVSERSTAHAADSTTGAAKA